MNRGVARDHSLPLERLRSTEQESSWKVSARAALKLTDFEDGRPEQSASPCVEQGLEQFRFAVVNSVESPPGDRA